jgi:hypothetical protein
VLRVCKDSDEYRAFYNGSTWFYFGSLRPSELVTFNSKKDWWSSWEDEFLAQQIVQLWFDERDRDLWFAMPRWLSAGLLQVAGTSQLDRTTNKLEFRVDDWERERVREAIRTGTSTKPRDLMKMAGEDFAGSSGKAYWQRHYEAGTFTRFLCAGAGAKDPRTKDLLRDYIRNLKAVTLELDAADKQEGGESEAKPKTEKEEEAYYKAKSEKWHSREQEVLDQVFERTFRSWSDAQWKDVEDAYLKGVQ